MVRRQTGGVYGVVVRVDLESAGNRARCGCFAGQAARVNAPPIAGTTYFESALFFSLCSACKRGACSDPPCGTRVLRSGNPRSPEVVRSGIFASLRVIPGLFPSYRRSTATAAGSHAFLTDMTSDTTLNTPRRAVRALV